METEAERIVRLLVDGHVYRAMLAAKDWVAGHPMTQKPEPLPDVCALCRRKECDGECGSVNR